MHEDLSHLSDAIKGADQVLATDESSGMEVGEGRLQQDQARDSLTKARVTIHSFRSELVEQDIAEGLKIARETRQEGERALKERNYRRMGLAFSMAAILAVLLGLFLYIRQIEGKSDV
jgi:hypothetical protein